MFIAEAYIERTYRFDKETNQFEKCEPYLENPCGTDYCMIMRDLKTLRGARNRVLKACWPKDVVEIRIYSVTNIYDRETYNLQRIEVRKGRKTSIQKLREKRKEGGKVLCQHLN